MVQDLGWNSDFYLRIFSFLPQFLKKFMFSTEFPLYLHQKCKVYFWAHSLDPYVYLDTSTVVYKPWNQVVADLFDSDLFQNRLAILGTLYFHVNFKISFLTSTQKSLKGFSLGCIFSLDLVRVFLINQYWIFQHMDKGIALLHLPYFLDYKTHFSPPKFGRKMGVCLIVRI